MLNIFSRKKEKIVIDMYTYNRVAFKHYKPDYTKKFMPKWFDEIKSRGVYGEFDKEHLDIFGDMRGCSGFTGMYTSGFVLPLWSDLLIDAQPFGGGYRYRFADGHSSAVQHPQAQRASYLPENDYVTLKLNSPWAIRCNRDIDFTWFQPTWNFDQPAEILIPPAVVNYKSVTHSTNINLAIPRADTEKFIKISANQAMVQIIPITEEDYEIRYHLVDEEEFDNLCTVDDSYRPTFINRHKGSKVKKCPFSGRIK